jgi:tRNA threonylcarbamoyladenosine biosynthesis protein TsaB
MKVLAIDSATASCSAALWVDGAVAAAERAELPRGQAEALMPMVDRVRVSAGIDFAALDRLAVTIGPGHFTGLRVGLAAARGLALATGKKLVGITTLAAVAAAVPQAERNDNVLLVALDSKRAEAYVQAFAADDKEMTSPAARKPDEFAQDMLRTMPAGTRFLVAGDAGDGLVALLAARGAEVRSSTAPMRPDAAVVAALAAAAPLPAGMPAPLYLHAAETTQPRRRPAT